MRNGKHIMKGKDVISSSELEYINIQSNLSKKIVLENKINLNAVKKVAGVDLAYWKKNSVEYAVCCIVVLDYQTCEVIEMQEYVDIVKVPYIPGCLAFREVPVFIQANNKIKSSPDLYFFDGNGYLHPRHMGLATHAGILMEKPTIGVAKSYYKIEGIDYAMPDNIQFSHTDIVIHGEIYGCVLRTHKGVRPIFLSVGNMIDLDTATKAVSKMVTKESHIPLPTRLADIMTHKARKTYF